MVQATSPAAWRSEQTLRVANDVQWDKPAPISGAIMALARLVRSRLRTLLRVEADLHELEMMILLELAGRGPVLRTELADALHVDKAAIGRAVKILEMRELVTSRAPRSPLSLSAAGIDAVASLTRLLARFEQQALQGISATRLKIARRALHAVHMASILALGGGMALRIAAPWKRHSSDACDPLTKELIQTARAISTIATERVCANCAFSPFQARVLMQVAETPAPARVLVRELDCDKGQLSRMLAALADEGLVRTERRRNGCLHLTPSGRIAYGRIAAEMAAQDWGYHAVLDLRAPVVMTRVFEQAAANLRGAAAAHGDDL